MKVHHAIKNSFDFIVLLLILGFGLGGLLLYRFDVSSQIAIVVLMGILYVFWGVFHHFHDRSLTGKVLMEYIGMAILISFVLILFLLRI